MERPPKRQKFDSEDDDAEIDWETGKSAKPHSLTRSISPPRKRERKVADGGSNAMAQKPNSGSMGTARSFPSPFELTKIKDLPASDNHDTVSLRDILGNPLIAECWDFNYLHDIDFLMAHFDADVRDLVRVHVVHGFWKKEDPCRLALYEEASRYSNVTLHGAYMPEIFGTHHSKMLIIRRHDDTAQVFIHTANMISRDWTNMTQGVWRSPLLPLLKGQQRDVGGMLPEVGSGERFKIDLIRYLRGYDRQRTVCKPIADALEGYDFAAVRAALIGSVPGRHKASGASTRWGHVALGHALRAVPVQQGKSEVVVQISSIATMGAKDTWLKETMFGAMSKGKCSSPLLAGKPSFKVVFPTPDEIRASLDGYRSGGSIHTKIQSKQQQEQLRYLTPMFHHWANDSPNGEKLDPSNLKCEAGRKRAAPHIKTYIRTGTNGIDWALLTSANLSKQAWGEAENASGEVRIASYEIGVLTWPALYAENAKMKAVFGTNHPEAVAGDKKLDNGDIGDKDGVLVGLRIPYDLPLQKYGNGEKPWVATATYMERDRFGQAWT